jgi:hypothetical protein
MIDFTGAHALILHPKGNLLVYAIKISSRDTLAKNFAGIQLSSVQAIPGCSCAPENKDSDDKPDNGLRIASEKVQHISP